MDHVLTLDPSGNFHEGKGTTGWSVWHNGELWDFGAIASDKFESQEEYWFEHEALFEEYNINRVVMESYRVFAHKSKQQINSAMETPQLIGYLRMVAWKRLIPVVFQDPKNKERVTDPILVKEGVFELRGNRHYCMNRSTVLHERDAIRHGVYYHRYRKK